MFHFTKSTNIPSIKKHGLLSYNQLKKNNIKFESNSNPLSQNLDEAKGYLDYVHFSKFQVFQFTRYGQINKQEYEWIAIQLDPFNKFYNDIEKVLYLDDNGASNSTKTIPYNEKSTWWEIPHNQAEVLIKDRIMPEHLIFS